MSLTDMVTEPNSLAKLIAVSVIDSMDMAFGVPLQVDAQSLASILNPSAGEKGSIAHVKIQGLVVEKHYFCAPIIPWVRKRKYREDTVGSGLVRVFVLSGLSGFMIVCLVVVVCWGFWCSRFR